MIPKATAKAALAKQLFVILIAVVNRYQNYGFMYNADNIVTRFSSLLYTSAYLHNIRINRHNGYERSIYNTFG